MYIHTHTYIHTEVRDLKKLLDKMTSDKNGAISARAAALQTLSEVETVLKTTEEELEKKTTALEKAVSRLYVCFVQCVSVLSVSACLSVSCLVLTRVCLYRVCVYVCLCPHRVLSMSVFVCIVSVWSVSLHTNVHRPKYVHTSA